MTTAPFSSPSRDAVLLHRVRVPGADREALRVRQRLERALHGVDWMPFGATSNAVLLVRRLVADVHSGEAFGSGVTRALREQARAGRRPWIHADATAAGAVWFADENELAACLVRDWLRGMLHDCWWWPSVLSGSSVESWLRVRILARGERFVPVLAQLAGAGHAVAWLRHMVERDVIAALGSVATAYSLPADFLVATTRVQARGAQPFDESPEAVVGTPPTKDRWQRPAARLLASVPELEGLDLPRPALRLLAWSLVALRDSGWLRTQGFHSALSMHIEGTTPDVAKDALWRTPDSSIVPARGIAQDAIARGQKPEPGSAPVRIAESPGTVETERRPNLESELSPFPDRVESGGSDDGRLPETSTNPVFLAEPMHPALIDSAGATPDEVSHASPAQAMVPAAEIETPSVETPPPRIDTEFGGIFYLLNAALEMALYCDFTMPRGKNLDLSPWDWLALIGRAWFGAEFVADPVWLVLAELAGREPGDEPGRDLDIPAGWLESQLVALDARLRLALDTEDTDAMRILVGRHRASLEITASAVRIHLELAALPLDLRIVGLDRDPGWIPAAGRAVYFHFD